MGRHAIKRQTLNDILTPGRPKKRPAAAMYLVRPVAAPMRSPTDDEVERIVAVVMSHRPKAVGTALAILPFMVGDGVALTYTLIAAVGAQFDDRRHRQSPAAAGPSPTSAGADRPTAPLS